MKQEVRVTGNINIDKLVGCERWLGGVMLRTAVLVVLVAICGASTRGEAAERRFSMTQAPAGGDFIGVTLNQYYLGKYLAECRVNRPEILNEVKSQLAKGGFYRKSTKDQRGKAVTLTVNVNPDYMLRVVTWRDEDCSACGGTGRGKAPLEKFTKQVAVNFNCVHCEGKGILEKHTTEKYFVLSSEDFENPEEGRKIMARRAYSGAPQGAEAWVERLVSKNPAERLEACLWLDRNYVRVGLEFQKIQPMLKKARYHEANNDKRIMVWQFWAGRGIDKEKKRAYYRIYADTKTGKITKKGFYEGK